MRPDDVRFWLLLWLMASSSTVSGLLAIWAALSPRHWFVRAAVLIGVVWLLAWVPAYDLAIVFIAQTACIVIALSVWRWRRARARHGGNALSQRSMRFRLVDLFLATAAIAAVAAFTARFPKDLRESSPIYAIWGSACGCAAIAACCVFLSGRKRILVGIVPLAAALLPSQVENLYGDAIFQVHNLPCLYEWDCPEWIWYPALATITALTAVWLVLLRIARPSTRDVRVVLSRWLLSILSLAIVAFPGVAFWEMITPTPIPVVQLPASNGYVELKRIGEELAAIDPLDADTASEAVLRKFVDENRQTFNNIQAALAHDSMVPLDYSSEDIDAFSAIHALGRAYLAKGRVAELDQRCDDACDDYLAMAKIAEKSARGGLLIDWLVSSAVLSGGLDGIQRVRAGLSSSQLRKACAMLVRLEANREPIQEVVALDRVWEEYTSGWPSRLDFLRSPPWIVYEQLDDAYRTELRLLECDLALHLYRQDHGLVPEALEKLVPDYLQSLPNDPYTMRPFIYRRQPQGFLLYSTGPDKTDNGGECKTQTRPPPAGEDISLNAPGDYCRIGDGTR